MPVVRNNRPSASPGAIAQSRKRADVDGVQQGARLVGIQNRRLAFLDDILRAAHGVRRIHVDDVAGDQPVEQHANGGQVLLDRRRRELALSDPSRRPRRGTAVRRASWCRPCASHQAAKRRVAHDGLQAASS